MVRFARPVAFAAGAALAAGGLVLATVPSQAQTGPQLIKLELQAGYTLLNTSTNKVTSTSSSAEQTITVGCNLDDVLSPNATLLDVNAIGTRVKLGYGKNGIGVAGNKDKSGTRCADVDAEYDQALEVTTGSSGSVWTAADLDIEFKGGSGLAWTAYRNGVVVDSSTDTVSTKITVTGDPSDKADNGPDSADGDNRRVLFVAANGLDYFDKLVLAPTNGGAISLEGGGDGTAASTLLPSTSASVFATPGGEGLLLCDKNDVDGVTENGVTVFLTNCASGSSVPYLLDRDGNDVTFAVPDSTTNNYRVSITWEPENAQLPVPADSKVAYYRQATDGELVEQPLGLCGGTSAAPTVPTDYDGNLSNGNQGFCIVGQSMTIGPVVDGVQKMVLTERLYGVGDPAFARAN